MINVSTSKIVLVISRKWLGAHSFADERLCNEGIR